ncbi:hypothetical protein E6W39_00675 [Kitasatospora acidiphila]|uniref:Uncharacterized protein n=1 Tax=Kitasatospora acidiphila TaxID=2567942 RepID=A0A540WGD1_9ACTN|nr:DUF6707 family protein [Kitasatospora acidiphila]TQF08086.1 hypothetical protein E6W39_00675 [Kitasatospora acidiphila]
MAATRTTSTAPSTTELIAGHRKRSAEERAAALLAAVPEGAAGHPEELGEFLLTVVADRAEERQVRLAALQALVAVPGGGPELLRLRRLLDAEPDKAVRRELGAALSGHLGAVVTARAAELAAGSGTPAALRSAARAVKTVRSRSPRDLQKVTSLAYACEAADRLDDARLVATAALGVLFTGDYAIWSPVESALALLWLHAGPEQRPVLRQIIDVGTALPDIARDPLARRLDGELLYSDRISRALAEGNRHTAAGYAQVQVMELALMLAYGGSAAWQAERITERRAADLALLRSIRFWRADMTITQEGRCMGRSGRIMRP